MNLIKARKKAGLTREQAAVKIGIAASTLGRYEKGHRIDSILLFKLAELYGVPKSKVHTLLDQQEAS